MERSPEALFELMVREHETGVRRLLLACVRDEGDAEDLFQEVFTGAWQSLDQFDLGRPFRPWLMGIARKKVQEYYRNQQTRHMHVQVLSPEAVDSIADELERLTPPDKDPIPDDHEALQDCLGGLSRDQADVVHRMYRQSKSCRTIASELGEAVEAIKKRVQRARAQLRDCIENKMKRAMTNA